MGRVWVEGEVSNFKAYASGHWYFSLKDERAQISCVMFAGRNRLVRDPIGNGMAVLVRGRLSVYEPRGQFQAIVDHVEPAGEGAMRVALERLTRRLGAEGLFAEERKRPLPAFPRHVGVVSSRAGAALRDVLAVIGRRFPCVAVTCFHVSVQGVDAPDQIVSAFNRAERMKSPPDVLILTRGGGSLEDLQAFNAEVVARRIARCAIVVVSAIGHETDFTIADRVADQRAPTPSAAAELVTPDRDELLRRLAGLRGAMRTRLLARIAGDRRLLNATGRRLVHPNRELEQRMQRSDELTRRLTAALGAYLARQRTAVAHQHQLLKHAGPAQRVAAAKDRVAHWRTRLRAAATAVQQRAGVRAAALTRALEAVGPLATMARGYAIVAKPDGGRWGKPVLSVADAEPGDDIVAHVVDGTLAATVSKVSARRDGDH